MKIDNLQLGNIFLAPLAGVSEVGFRHACKLGGADLTFTEMVSSKALSYESEKTKELLITSQIETPKAVQIFGHEPEVMAQACKRKELQKFDIIDINFGCPAPKIVNNGDGSALLKNLPLVRQIVESCVKAINKPISCKFRKGFLAEDNIAVDMAKLCEDAGAKMLTIHGRTRSQQYAGQVDYETIAKVKASVKIPVVGNGDVVDEATYNKMLSTGVDAVMIGRGALGDPNIFNRLKGRQQIEKLELIKQHIQILRHNYDERFVNVTMRKHLLWYVAGITGATKIKQHIATSDNLDYSLSLVAQLLNQAVSGNF
ncbi:MAG: tRNA dihydrouridine synthase DusB [Clostridiales bacterium]|nr:tRNA dihydrouridine synthase DusB [Clostridiales bacterium]